ncbi:ligase [Bacteroidia bacterium]|nr:ligase [Bacteroidia bacterium]
MTRNDRKIASVVFFLFLCLIIYIYIKSSQADSFLIYKYTAVAACYFVVKHLEHKQILLYALALSGSLQSCVAFLQKTGIAASNNMMFAVTGSFGNPGQLGGYLAVCGVVAILLLINAIKNRHKFNICFLSVCVMLQIFGLYLADSRAAFLGLAVGLACYFLPKIKKHKKIIIGSIILLIFVVAVSLYFYRPASANARLLIWRVSAEMIADKPLLGHGAGAFSKKYMLYQAQYFADNPNSVFVSVADNAAYPFNELLNIAIQYGLVGLLIVLAVFYLAFRSKGAAIFKASLAALTAFAMFSYPLAVFPLLLLFAVCLDGVWGDTVIAGLVTERSRSMTRNPLCFSVIAGLVTERSRSMTRNPLKRLFIFVICLLAGFFAVKNIIFLNRLSNEISKNIFTEQSYEKMRHNRTYHDYYMNYLTEQPNIEHSGRITELLPSCENYCLLGEYFLAQKDYPEAENTLQTAANMIPTRLRPQYLLWLLYTETENADAARNTAEKILKTPLKTESIYTLKVKAQMKKYLETEK